MGSIVISDVVSDIARFPYTMVVGDAHQMTSTGTGTSQTPPSRSRTSSHSSNAAYVHQRQASATSLPPSSAGGSTTSSQYFPQRNQASVHSAAPPSRTPSQPLPNEHSGAFSQPSSHIYTANPLPSIRIPDSSQGYDQSGFPLSSTPSGLGPSPPSPRLQPTLRSSLSLSGLVPDSPNRIKVRDLNHIQSFASEEVLTRSRHGSRRSLRGRYDGGQQYEISAMPVTDIIEMVAGLLTKITTTNDRQHEHLHRHIPPPEGATGLSQQTTSVLAFHGKNVPSITILSYLSRIHKYCPTTYEVFLSLLVYFDRMTEMVNSGPLSSFRDIGEPKEADSSPHSTAGSTSSNGLNMASGVHISASPASGPAESRDDPRVPQSPSMPPEIVPDTNTYSLAHYFVVDSFNIHRLVIAGVTCASKFFSDVFYTNSRYAKVCQHVLLKFKRVAKLI